MSIYLNVFDPAQSDCCFFAPCTNILTYLLTYLNVPNPSTSIYAERKLIVYIHNAPTFHVSRRRREMYCGHPRLCVCVCVSVSVRVCTPTLLHRRGCNLGNGTG